MPGRRPLPVLAAIAGLAAVLLAPAGLSAAPAPPGVLAEVAPGGARSSLGAGASPAVDPALVRALERRAGHPLPDIRRWYRIEADGAADARRIARRLDARAGIEATVELAPAPPPAFCRPAPAGGWPVFGAQGSTPDLSGLQDYRAGLGIPAGAVGAGVTIADVEYDWLGSHEELAALGLGTAQEPPGGLPAGFDAENHGTAVLGILGATAGGGTGITGLAHGARVRALSPYLPEAPATYNLPEAITRAALGLKAGDVLLIEQQVDLNPDPAVGLYAPVESHPSVHDVIRAVVDAGVIVVEPAGNGGRDLATLGIPWLAGPAAAGHSGALIVGAAGSAATQNDLRRTWVSNHGGRVDVQGYGEGVLTTGYGTALGPFDPPQRRYTACFDGTSSAAATVAGAVAALQGLEIAQDGGPLAPAQLRDALVQTGLPQPAADTARIGPRPQVAAAAQAARGSTPPATPGPGPAPQPGPPLQPAPPPLPQAGTAGLGTARAAARGLGAGIVRGRGAMVLSLTLRGAAPDAKLRVGGRAIRLVRGRAVLRGLRPGRLIVRVSAAARTTTVFRVMLPARGAARVVRL